MYKEFEGEVWKTWKAQANLLVVTVAGMSENFFAKKFCEKWRKEGVSYIDGPDQKTEEFNILNLNWTSNGKAVEQASEYLQKAERERFAIIVNKPGKLGTTEFRESYVGQHVYGMYYLGVLPEDMMGIFADELGLKVVGADLARVYRLTGGVGKWVKWLMVHKEKLNMKSDELLAAEDFRLVLEPTAGLVGECSDEQLEKLGLWKDGQWKGEILGEYFRKNQKRKKPAVEITADLGIVENGRASGARLTKLEADILRRMIENEGVITKEEVSGVKWGEGKYDKFSDQAIGKTMQRLGSKLAEYKIEAIRGYGFRMV